MHLKTRNVNTAFRELVTLFTGKTYVDIKYTGNKPTEIQCTDPVIVSKSSRNGNVLLIDEPVTITYTHPKERVLFNAARDANPFFHLYEALWMLAGRNDVASVAYYAKQMNEYSDDGKMLNGAYGYRWRQALAIYDKDNSKPEAYQWQIVDQLDLLVDHLKADPNSRRAVLQMWNVEDDLLKIGSSKDVCCNLSVMFSIRTILDSDKSATAESTRARLRSTQYLDMTVTNRSNDMVWGLLGANYVHFTFLQEYMAARLGCEVGLYHHFTNNLHVYEWNWKPDEWLNEHEIMHDEYKNIEDGSEFKTIPLIKNPEIFEQELPILVEHFNGVHKTNYEIDNLLEPFFRKVAGPALRAFQFHKLGETITGIRMCELIEANDWRFACTQWLQRRAKAS